MIVRPRSSKLALAGAAFFLAFPSLVSARFQNDFSDYPRKAIPCLEEADENSGCNGETVPTMNACLCADGGGFLTNSARCIGEKAPGDLDTIQTAYSVFKINCDNSNTPLSMNLADFVSLAQEAEDKPSGTKTDGTPEPTESGGADKNTDKEDKGGLSMGVIIGIAVGGAVLIAGIVLTVVLMRRRKKRNLEESHPMLVNQGFNSTGSSNNGFGGAFGGTGAAGGTGTMYHSPNDVKADVSSHPSSPSTWRPATQSPVPSHNRLSPNPPQQGAWAAAAVGGGNGANVDPRHASWASQQSWNPHQSWNAATQPYHTLGAQGNQQMMAPPQPPQQQFGPPVFELPNSPATQLPHQPPPVEMPASPMDAQQGQQNQQGGNQYFGQSRY